MDHDRSLHFQIMGMDCAEEVAVLRRSVGPVVGGEDRLSFDVLSGRMTVAAGDQPVDVDAVLAAVSATGMQAERWTGQSGTASTVSTSAWRQGLLWTSLSGGFLLLGLLVRLGVALETFAGPILEITIRGLYGLAIVCGLRLVAPKAWRAARGLRPDMNLLMTVAVLGAIVIGEYLEGASVAFLFALSNALESWSIRRAHRAISALMDLAPPTARVRDREGTEKELPIEEVAAGSRIVVNPGNRIPLDGVVMAGRSDVNQSPITGESMPVEKQSGDTVFAGTVNGNGALEIETTKPADETTLAHIARMIDEAQSRRSPSERWVDRFARIYTPAVMGVALLVFLVPPLALGQTWSVWFYRSLVLLVIACPCALVISTPVSVVAALTAAARQGVLIKGGVFLEAISHVRAFAFDKTGTLTEGKPRVHTVISLNGHTETELLERVTALEARSDHPLAKAILDHARQLGVSIRPAADYQEIPGEGASGSWNGETYWLGSARLMAERGQETAERRERIAELAAQGQTVVVVGSARHVCGLLGLADTVRHTSRSALNELRALGVEHLEMLTGDSRATGTAIGRSVGVDEIRAELLPAEKVDAVEALVERFGSAAMVGDGVNDAPALATATVGIAMGVAGSDAAIETADIALMSNDLSKLPWTVRLSRRTVGVIQQNIAFALAVKAAFVILTFFGLATLWGAIAADMGTSLLVIFNGMRLLRERQGGATH